MFKTIARWFGYSRGPVERPGAWPELQRTPPTPAVSQPKSRMENITWGDMLERFDKDARQARFERNEAYKDRDLWYKKAVAAEDRLVDQGACLQNTLEENRKLKEDLSEFQSFPKPFSASLLSPFIQLQLFKSEQKAEEQSRKRLEVMGAVREALGAQEGEDPLQVIKQLRGQHAEAGRLWREAKAEVERLKEDMQRKLDLQWEAAKAVAAERDELQARLAAIDAAKAGEPPIPRLVDFPGTTVNPFPVIKALEAWGRQGWDASAALRLDVEFLVGEWQRLQPGGSPPPGGIRTLVQWIRTSVAEKLTEADMVRQGNVWWDQPTLEAARAAGRDAALQEGTEWVVSSLMTWRKDWMFTLDGFTDAEFERGIRGALARPNAAPGKEVPHA